MNEKNIIFFIAIAIELVCLGVVYKCYFNKEIKKNKSLRRLGTITCFIICLFIILNIALIFKVNIEAKNDKIDDVENHIIKE